MPDQGGFSIIVDSKDSGKRLDLFISSFLADCSRKLASQLIQEGIISVGNSTKKPSYRIKTGEMVSGYIPLKKHVQLNPEPIDINIIFEDQDIIILNKKPGIVVHPSPGHESGTLVNGLLYHCPDITGINGELRPGIVHRLDKDTSGVMVVAKNQTSHLKLAEQFKKRTVYKKYLALVYGNVKNKTGEIRLPIGRHRLDRKKMSANSYKTREAKTDWKIRERFDKITFLELNILTGRTHQIRVHCMEIDHPVVGDPVYCKKKAGKGLVAGNEIFNLINSLSRQMLHAWQISFIHPSSQKRVIFEAKIHKDMEKLLSELRALKKYK